MTDTLHRFAHQRLEAYRYAIELFAGVERLAATFPAGHADLKDQLRRAAGSDVRNIAEGANRIAPRDKAARFAIALGEVAECDATLEMALVIGLARGEECDALRRLADRISRMLTGLVRRQ